MPLCPRCLESELLPPAGEYDARACAGCRGAWLPGDAARRIIEPSVGPLDALPVVPVGTGALRCPDCEAELVRRHADVVEVDVCAAHGVWFDHERIRPAAGRRRGVATLAAGAVAVAAVATTPSPMLDDGRQLASTNSDAVADGVEAVFEVVSNGGELVEVAATGIAAVAEAAGAVIEVVGAGLGLVVRMFEVLAALFDGQ